jgi:murein DD-endopeptidase MepM/ murein hydrolase activator NlpD
VFGNPVQGPRVVPFGAARQAYDKLPNGRPSFRVTQRFGDLDAFFRDRIHGAMDLGNFYCADRVLSMASGKVQHINDPNGALGIRIAHGNGYSTEYWHLRKRLVGNGTAVAAGLAIGEVGSTGLDIGGCHLHVVVRDTAGRAVDPWPLLNQNIVSYRILKGYPINIRSGAGTNYTIFATSTRAGIIRARDKVSLGPVNQKMRYGGTVTGSDGKPWDKVYLNAAYRYVRSDLLLKA